MKDNNKILIVILIIIGIFLFIRYYPNLTQTGAIESNQDLNNFQKTVITCSQVDDCSNYLISNGVSQENINLVEFQCQDNLCWFKQK